MTLLDYFTTQIHKKKTSYLIDKLKYFAMGKGLKTQVLTTTE